LPYTFHLGTLCFWATRVDYRQGQSTEYEVDVEASDETEGIVYAHHLRDDLAVGFTHKPLEYEVSDREMSR
jgi:hypothetical protein